MYIQHTDSSASSQLHDLLFPQSPQGLDVVIEQLQKTDCPASNVPLMRATNDKLKQTIFFRPRCKRWSCPVCGQMNTSLWAWRASEGARALLTGKQGLAFVTITSNEKLSAGASWWVLPKAWKKLQARIRYATGGYQYYAVPELHKSGKVHLHMLTTATLRKKWWKDNARECGFGYQNDVQEVVAVGGVSSYVSKYLSKTLEVSDLPAGTRRIRTSQAWPKLPPMEAAEGWEMSLVGDEPLNYAVAVQQRRGFVVTFAGSKSAWTLIDASKVE